MLSNKVAEELYHDHAASMPIIDYHCHLSPKDIAEDRVFQSITEAWLEGDHYKWRAMRSNGVDERYVTGKDTTDQEKFQKWAETVPYTVKNPLYHWTHLELKRYFDIAQILNGSTGDEIYKATTELLRKPEYSCQGLLQKMNVTTVCTTDDPLDDLGFHQQFADKGKGVTMFPAFRPDKLYAIETDTYGDYLKKLEEVVGFAVNSLDTLLEAAKQRIEYFHENGGRLSDHGLEQLLSLIHI